MCAETAREEGSVLVLMPATVLVLLLLAALAVDAAVVFLAQRELVDATAAAANDAAAVALDERAFYEDGTLVLDVSRAQQVAATSFHARAVGWLAPGVPEVHVEQGRPPQVRVRAQATVRLVFARGLPGAAGTRTVSATSVASPDPGG